MILTREEIDHKMDIVASALLRDDPDPPKELFELVSHSLVCLGSIANSLERIAIRLAK